MEFERKALDEILGAVNNDMEYNNNAIETLGGMKARLVNRGKPAGYVVTSDGTFMVTVEMVSRAIMVAE